MGGRPPYTLPANLFFIIFPLLMTMTTMLSSHAGPIVLSSMTDFHLDTTKVINPLLPFPFCPLPQFNWDNRHCQLTVYFPCFTSLITCIVLSQNNFILSDFQAIFQAFNLSFLCHSQHANISLGLHLFPYCSCMQI